ncbi:TPA: hypothetical protein DCZ32_03250 [Candidatus Uhrbacteria bacterium]|nr:hypothetical protein [Candidatus Uhrbacteria bacterium]
MLCGAFFVSCFFAGFFCFVFFFLFFSFFFLFLRASHKIYARKRGNDFAFLFAHRFCICKPFK